MPVAKSTNADADGKLNGRAGRPYRAIFDVWSSWQRFSVALAVAIGLLFPKVLLGLESFFYRDFGVLAYPVVFHARESFWRGELPLWNPLSNCGVPFLAQWGTMVLYPFSLFYLVLPLPWSLNFFCLAHLFWGGLGMYQLAARWIENRFAAAVAATAFVFNGVTFSCFIWPNYLVAIGWMPWVVLAVERAWLTGGRRIALASIVAALQMLSGAPELVMLTWLLIAGVWVAAVIQKSAPASALVGRMLVIVILASGLMAAQVLPFVELLGHSQRGLSVATTKWSMPPWGWANLLVPLFHCFLTPQGVFFQLGQEFMSSTYLGIAVLTLAFLAVCVARHWRLWWLAFLLLFSLIMALGNNGFLFAWVQRFIPFVGLARYPIKFMLLAAFAGSLLAAYGVERLDRSQLTAQPWRRLGAIVILLLSVIAVILWFGWRYRLPLDQWTATWWNGVYRALFLIGIVGSFAIAVTWKRSAAAVARMSAFSGVRPSSGAATSARLAAIEDSNPTSRFNLAAPEDGRTPLNRLAKIAVLVLLVLDAHTHVPLQNPTLPASALAPGQVTRDFPVPAQGEGRIMISPRAEQLLLMSTVADLQNDFLGKRIAHWSNLNLLEGTPKVNGAATLQIREQMEVQALLYASTNTDLPRLADFLSVAYVTSPGQILEWTKRSTQLPMLTVGQKPVFAERSAILSSITNETFEPAKIVYVGPDAAQWLSARNRTDAKILSQRFSAHRIEATVSASEATVLVVAQSFYPAWHAYVDGKPAQLLRANYAFQCVPVSAGQHRIEIIYQDRAFWSGAMVSAFSLLVCAIGGFAKPVQSMDANVRRKLARDFITQAQADL